MDMCPASEVHIRSRSEVVPIFFDSLEQLLRGQVQNVRIALDAGIFDQWSEEG